MNDKDISKMLPDWTLTYVLSENSTEKIYQAEKESASGNKYALVRACFIPGIDDKADAPGGEAADKEKLREKNAAALLKCKKEFAFFRSMSGKAGWLNLKESYDLSNTDGTQSLAVARFGCASSLSGFIDENGLTEGALLKMAIDICKGLEHAKKAGKVHGTLTPDCIFVDDNCKFRIGKIDIDVAETKKLTDTSLSALRFTAPWAVNFGANHAGDTYSLGLIMYYFLNGRKLPFEDELPVEKATEKRLSKAKLPLPSYDAGRITEIVMKACSVPKEERYATPYAMRKDLEEVYFRLHKKLEEKRIKERAEQKRLESEKMSASEVEAAKDISANREHQKDESELKVEKQKKTKRNAALILSAIIAVLAALYFLVPGLIDKLEYKDIGRHSILLASNYYKDTERAEEFAFDFVYDGSEKEPAIVVEGLENLVEGVDYTVTYENNIEVGTATIKVEGIGDYKGSNSRTFNIKPYNPEDITSLEATDITKDSVVLKWTKSEKANRYIIYKYHDKIKDWGDREYIVDGSQDSILITGLKPGTDYSFRVRSAFVSEDGKEKKGSGVTVDFTTDAE